MTHALRSLLLATACGAVLATPVAAQSVVSFGDSLSDNGNLFSVTSRVAPPAAPPSPPYFQGRFSNGPVFTELLAGGAGSMQRAGAGGVLGQFGLPTSVDPNASQNYAFGGARTDRLDFIPPGIPDQIDLFVAQDGRFAPGDLVTLYGGANDIFQAFSAVGAGQAAPTILQPTSIGAAANISGSAARLAGLGAPTLVVLNLPDLGRTPQFSANPLTAALASQATTVFNTALAQGVGQVAAANAQTNTHFVDVEPLFREIAADPARFGFSNVTQGCLAVASCARGSQEVQNAFLFFDAVHPSARAHSLLADLVTDHLTAGARAGDAASISDVAIATRIEGENELRARARQHLARTADISEGADLAGPDGSAPFWGNAYLSVGGMHFDHDASFDYSAGSLRLGGDHRANEGFLFGGAVSATRGEVDNSDLTYDTQSFEADVYAMFARGPAFVTFTGGVAHFDFDDIRRQTAVAGLVNDGGNTNGFAANVGAEAGYEVELGGGFTATPALALTYAYTDIDRFSETGAGARIVYGGHDRDALVGAANLHLGYGTLLAGRPIHIAGRIGYEETLSDGGSGIASFVRESPARGSFSSFSELPARGLILGIEAETDLTERVGFSAHYSAGFGDEIDNSHVGSLALNVRF